VLSIVLFAGAVFVWSLDGNDATVQASEMLDEQSATAKELDEIDAIGETIGIDVPKNNHRDSSSDFSAVQVDGTDKIAAKELSPIDFEN
jgi:hypothetical protein